MKFCFFGSGIYDSLTGNPPGGAESQVALLAKALAENGQEVFVIENGKCKKSLAINNISVFFTAASRLKVLRFFVQKIPNMFRFMKRIRPDYVYVRGISQWSLIPLFFSVLPKGPRFIQAIPSDIDTLSFRKRFRYVFRVKTSLFSWIKNDLPSSLVFPVLKRYSDIILCQHSGQLASLSDYKDKCYVFTNIYDKPVKNSSQAKSKDYFIYVGSLNERKGLSDLICLIDEAKSQNFRIIGYVQGPDAMIKMKVLQAAENVEISDHLPNDEVISAISDAKALINVSKYEGFPNTFLEAWACGVPVVSLHVNPGNVIIENNLGYFAGGDMEQMKSFIMNFINRFSEETMKEYVIRNHSFTGSTVKFLDIIRKTDSN